MDSIISYSGHLNLVAGLASVAFAVIANYSPLRRYQFGRSGIYNLVAASIGFGIFVFGYFNARAVAGYVAPWYFIFIGVITVIVFIIVSEYLWPNCIDVRASGLVLSLILYSIGIGLILFGVMGGAASLNFVKVYGKVVSGEVRSGNKVVPSYAVFMQTDIDGVAFESMTDNEGNYIFYIKRDEMSHVTRISVCSREKPMVFRNIDFEEAEVSGREREVLPPLKLKAGVEKCG